MEIKLHTQMTVFHFLRPTSNHRNKLPVKKAEKSKGQINHEEGIRLV